MPAAAQAPSLQQRRLRAQAASCLPPAHTHLPVRRGQAVAGRTRPTKPQSSDNRISYTSYRDLFGLELYRSFKNPKGTLKERQRSRGADSGCERAVGCGAAYPGPRARSAPPLPPEQPGSPPYSPAGPSTARQPLTEPPRPLPALLRAGR